MKMRLLKYLNEEYVAMGTYSIYANPSNKELRDACNNSEHRCRFFVDVNNKNLYVWDYRQLHEDTSRILNKEQIYNKYPYNGLKELWGEAELDGIKLKVENIYIIAVVKILRNEPIQEKKFYDKIKFVSRWMDDSLENFFKMLI
jgi:hypothetical protein